LRVCFADALLVLSVGGRSLVRGSKLTVGQIVSCDSHRADLAFRWSVRMQMPARRRRQIAAMGGAAVRRRAQS
jgi:hypothetical protein